MSTNTCQPTFHSSCSAGGTIEVPSSAPIKGLRFSGGPARSPEDTSAAAQPPAVTASSAAQLPAVTSSPAAQLPAVTVAAQPPLTEVASTARVIATETAPTRKD
jgi:hypothetical protein